MAEVTQPKWEGKLTAKLSGPKVHQVWPLLADFCSINKWIPIDTCYRVEGVPGQPGVIRYCASTLPSSDGGTTIKWCKEKLLSIDPIKRCLIYEAVDSNAGFKSYVSTIKVSPINGSSGGGDGDGCLIEWSYTADPVEGFTCDSFTAYIDSDLQVMAERMEKAL